MKKVFIFTLAALLALGGAQAQTKKVSPQANPAQAPVMTVTNDAKKPAAKPAAQSKVQKKDASKEAAAKKDMKKRDYITTKPLDNGAREAGMESPLFKVMMERRTDREFLDEEIPMEMLSSLLWAAYGINRPEEGKRVAPSACNSQEFDIYLFTQEGIWRCDYEKGALGLIMKGDHRAEISKQEHFAKAPVSLVLVADYSRMERIKEQADREFYAAVDAGYISQNIYLWCASAGFGTVACGAINRENLNLLLSVTDGKAILAHPVGRVQ